MAKSSTTLLSHVSVAESIFNEIVSGHDSYYYYYGRNLPFSGSGTYVEDIIQDYNYENTTRSNIVLLKKINASDVSFCSHRHEWKSGTIYDMYDDSYHGASLVSIDITSHGSGYSNNPIVIIGNPDTGGTLATAEAVVVNGSIQSIMITDYGSNYSTPPIVAIYDETGVGAKATAVIGQTNLSYSGVSALPDAVFYVLTDEYKVYKCLWNNNNSASTVKPTETYSETFKTSDGYIWKFMFYLPESIRRKWLIPTHFPVTRELTNSIHSNGGIDTVSIAIHGSGYTRGSATQAYMVGDGLGCVLNPVVSNTSTEIVDVVVDNSGVGYKPTTSKWIKSITRSANVVSVVTTNAHNIVPGISVTISGNSSFNGTFTVLSVTDANTFTYNEVKADSLIDYGNLTFTNSPITISSISLQNNVVTVVTTTPHNLQQHNAVTISGTVNFNGKFKIESIVNATTFKFSKNGVNGLNESVGSIAFDSINFAQLKLLSNVVTVTCSDAHNFSVGSSITIASGNATFDGTFTIASIIDYKTFTYAKTGTDTTVDSLQLSYSTSIHIIGAGIGKYGNNSALLTPRIFQTSGFNYITAPNITIVPVNGGIDGTATCTIFNGKVDNIIIGTSGSGYIAEPNIVFDSGTAAAHAIVHNGSIISIEPNYIVDGVSIIDPGIGYSDDSDITITVTGDGTGAKILPITNSNGEIISTIVETPGTGYTYAIINVTSTNGSGAHLTASVNKGNPDTLQYLTEVQAIPGAIHVIKVENGGTGYTTATVTISGDGANCAATPTIVGGVITEINVTNAGINYSFANVSISGDGTNASARAIISPYNGHGKDAVKELYANNLIFFSTLSNNDIIDSTLITNDYRQYGIIKNPTKYNSDLLFVDSIGVSCFIVYGTFITTDFVQDEYVKITSNGIDHQLMVVEVTAGKLFLLHMDGYSPKIGDEIVKVTNISKHFTATNVINPSFNKYSGDMVYSNNVSAFAQSESQVIKSRTIVQF